jgi:hypothetical protein
MKRLAALIGREGAQGEPRELQNCSRVLAAAVADNPGKVVSTIESLNLVDELPNRALQAELLKG